VAIGLLGASIAFPYFFFARTFGSYTLLLAVVAAAVSLAALFIRRSRWYALGALTGLIGTIAYIWATAGTSVAPVLA
jgi:hypothetical protein